MVTILKLFVQSPSLPPIVLELVSGDLQSMSIVKVMGSSEVARFEGKRESSELRLCAFRFSTKDGSDSRMASLYDRSDPW